MADIDMFMANGLLGTTDSVSDEILPRIDTFKSNGLLNASDPGPLASSSGSSFTQSGLLSDLTTVAEASTHLQAAESFRPNGLLCDSDQLSESLPAHQSQEESLPSISDLLQPYTRSVSSSTEACVTIRPPSISASTYDGKTVNIRRKPKASRLQAENAREDTLKLLEVPIHKLMDNLSQSTAARLAHPESGVLTSDMTDIVENELWVDRYRPKRFTELLGDERVHRETMSWLKEWDRCVFGKRKAPGKIKKLVQHDESKFAYEDDYHRPREKILLLSGPPGLGKTTLAHVLASQAGYDVLEINASDARSGQVVDDRIRPALESGSAVGSKRPVCVIVDEIDGATGAGENSSSFVHKLVQMVFEKQKKKHRPGEKRDPKAKRPILRPLICICNDLYASSLTKLRPHARIIRFTRPADIHLIKRLREVCENEGLKADSRALTALVGIAKGDMRGCLNALQFIKARNQAVTEPVLRAATSGMKEGDTSFFNVLNSLFAPLSKKRVKELAMSEGDEGRYVGRLSRDLEASDALDKVAWGCFEHYANLKQFDATFDRYEKANEWLLTFDVLSGTMRSEREYAIMPYLAYNLVPFYPLFQERGGSRVERPKADWENLVKTRTNEEIYKSLSRCIRATSNHRSAGLRHLLANEIMQLEFAPLINRIISPPLRPVNSQVIKAEERALLARLVDIMVTMELRFIQEKAEDGQLVYRLDPPIDVFVTYDGKRAGDIPVSRYATRHLVSGEIDAQLIARQAEATEKGKTKSLDFFRSGNKITEASDDQQNEVPEHQDDEGQFLAATDSANSISKKRKADGLIDPVDKPPVDFFGRPIAIAMNGPSIKSGEPALKKYRLSYRYNEGNSAAVRKPVKVGAFL